MVKNIKSLFCISIILLLTAVNVFSQTKTASESQGNQTNVTRSAFDENDTSFFAEDTNSSNTQSSYKSPSTAKMIIKMIVVLALVIAALYGIMLFFKKKNNTVQSDDDFLRRVSSLTLSPGKSVEIVTLVDRGFILGVTDSNINLIAEIEDKEMISALNLNFDKKQNTKKPMNFSDVLDMFMPANSRRNNSIYSQPENTQTPESPEENNGNE